LMRSPELHLLVLYDRCETKVEKVPEPPTSWT
jgi:hypothetical protein